jgi:outer membrane protein assembly factor BamB
MGLIGTFPVRKGSVWNVRLGGESFPGTPAVADGMVYVASSSGKVFKFQAADGVPVWTFDAGATVSESVSVTRHHVVVGDDRGRVHIIDVNTGESKQHIELSGPIASAPVITNDTLYVATVDGKLFAIR